jgi:hypothetical protein
MYKTMSLNLENRCAVRKLTAACWIRAFLQVLSFAVLLGVSGLLLPVNAGSQSQTEPQSAAKPAPVKKKYRLRISKQGTTGISLKADKANLSDIAAELSKRLGAKVILGPGMAKEAITVEFSDLMLEPALRLLAPHTYIDYEIKADSQPTPLGIYLLGYNDPEPATSAVVQATTQALMIQGNTEDTGEATENDPDSPLRIEFDDDGNKLTIKSKKQPLALVVLQIGDLLGVPVGLNYESDEVVDLDLKDEPIEDAIPRVSPNLRLYVRADLNKAHRTPFRLALVPPPAKNEGQ